MASWQRISQDIAELKLPVFFSFGNFGYLHALFRAERHGFFIFILMALLEKQLFVKKSGIPNSGKGLYTKKPIPKGTRIVEYKGRISKWKDVKDDDGKNGYIFYVNRNHVINALPTKSALARYANDANGLVKIKGVRNNCDYITDGLKAYIESKRAIPAGGEILVDYGKDYWKVIRENLKLKKGESGKKASKPAGEKKEKAKKRKANGQNILRDVKVKKDQAEKQVRDITRKSRGKNPIGVRTSVGKKGVARKKVAA